MPLEGTADGKTKHEPLLLTVQLAESYAIISNLLTFVFPVTPVLPPTIEQILELLSVAQKYEMANVLIRIRDFAARHGPALICPETALHAYSLAWKYGLREEACLAARETLNFSMTIEDFEDKFNIINGLALYELWKYRQQALLGLSVRLSRDSLDCSFFNSKVYHILSGVDLDCEETIEPAGIPLWLDDYLDSVAEDPSRLDLTTFHLSLTSHVSPIDHEIDDSDNCKTISGETIRDFWSALTAVVHESIREVGSTILIPRIPNLSLPTG